jgi:hypothetical protein
MGEPVPAGLVSRRLGVTRNVFGTVDSERWFRQRWIRRLGLGGALSIQITSKSTRQYQSMNRNFLLNINSVN